MDVFGEVGDLDTMWSDGRPPTCSPGRCQNREVQVADLNYDLVFPPHQRFVFVPSLHAWRLQGAHHGNDGKDNISQHFDVYARSGYD